MNNSISNCAVKVAVRERPTEHHAFQNSTASSSVIQYHSNANILIVNEKPFTFDYILRPEVTQEQVFNSLIKPLLQKFQLGFNCTALAYGQTGTGKSYSMGLELNNFNGLHLGIVPRCLEQLFAADLENVANNDQLEKQISISFIEIYNEKVFDLLVENTNEPIMSKGSKYPGGIRKLVSNLQDCYDILMLGNKNRHVRPTKMNAQSSRSHAVFTVHLSKKSTNLDGIDIITTSSMNLVDLAGSESVRRTGHIGMAMSEGVNINQGLLSIGKVLHAMKMGFKVIPYRDSVLSLVLQESLNPNSYLTLLACVSPLRENLSATLSTLRFAQNAKQLKNSPKINDILAKIKTDKKYRNTYSEQCKINTPRQPPCVVNHTFSTPQKEIPQLNKCNLTENCSNKNRILNSKRVFNFDLQRNHDNSFDFARISNISTSTVADAPVNNKPNRSFNTAMNEYMSNFESKMENLFMKVIQTNLPKLLSEKSNSVNSNVGNQISEYTRDDIKFLMREVIAESCTRQNEDSSSLKIKASRKTLPINSDSNSEMLYASHETFNIPKAAVHNAPVCSSSPLAVLVDQQDDDTLQYTSNKIDNNINVKHPRRSTRIATKQELNYTPNLYNLNPASKSSRIAETASKRKRKTIFGTYEVRSRKKITNEHIDNYYNCLYNKNKIKTTKYRSAVLNLLNNGTLKELQILPQIGPKTAMKILMHRCHNGNFKSLKHLQKLPIWYGCTWKKFATENLLM